MNIKFRFFQRLTTGQRMAVFQAFSVLGDAFDGKLTRPEEDSLLDLMMARIRGADDVAPIPMILHCPKCHLQHIDAATEGWTNAPHRSHLCHGCDHIWRPADVPTEGVKVIQTRGKNDTPDAAWDAAKEMAARRVEADCTGFRENDAQLDKIAADIRGMPYREPVALDHEQQTAGIWKASS